MNERVTEFLRTFLPNFLCPIKTSFLSPPLARYELWGVVVVVGSCGGTNGGTSASACVFCMLHEKSQASILLEIYLTVYPVYYHY